MKDVVTRDQPRGAGLLRADPRAPTPAMTFLSWLQVRRYYRLLVHARLQRSVRSRLTPPISICVARLQRGRGDRRLDALDALACATRSTRSCWPTTARPTRRSQRVIEAFDMHRVDQPEHVQLETKRVRGVWRSEIHSGLVVIDKENGGKCDALNAAINFARYPLVCCVDADSLLEPEALVTIVRPFIERPDRTIAAGGDHPRRQRLRGHARARDQDRAPEAVAADVPDRRVPARVHRRAHRLEHDQLAADHLGRVRDLPQGRRDRRRRVRDRLDRRGLRARACACTARMRELKRPYHIAFVPDPGLLDGGARRASSSSAASATAGIAA